MGKPTPEEEQAIRDHVAANREALRRAVGTTARNCRGLLVGSVGIGLDHTIEDPARQWWARVHLANGRVTQEVLVEGHQSGLAALEALNMRLNAVMRARARRRR